VLRRIFGPKGDEVTGEWRRLQNKELHVLNSSINPIRMTKSIRMRWAGHVEYMGKRSSVYKILVGKPEGRNSLENPRRRWKNNIKVDLREMGWGHGPDRCV
jgi:hypothetical protein